MFEHALADHLKEQLSPDAIILHGSRARGHSRAGSDWDFILVYQSEATHVNGRGSILGQNIEYSIVTVPVADIWETFGAKLSHARVLYEVDAVGTTLLDQAEKYYADGVHWSAAKKEAHRLWLEGRIEGMYHYTDDHVMFYKYFSDAYSRLTNYWYWVKQHKHSEPIYIAISEIQAQDPRFHKLLNDFTSPESSLVEKVSTCEEICRYLFL